MSPSAHLSHTRDQCGEVVESVTASVVVTTIVSSLLGSTQADDPFRNAKSIYTRLLPFFKAADECLDPCTALNGVLSELVTILQGKFQGVASSGLLFAKVAEHACRLIDDDERLSSRAFLIRDVAERAESRLELHYAEKLLNWAQQTLVSTCGSFRDMEVAEKVAFAARSFPYMGHYSLMVAQEARLIASMRQVDHIVFCGSGPLPLSGALLAAHLGVRVTLVDCDECAVRVSRSLISSWEQCEILPAGQINVRHLDGIRMRFRAPADKPASKVDGRGSAYRSNSDNVDDFMNSRYLHNDEGEEIFVCDVLFIAALVPNSVKEKLLRSAAELRESSPLVVLRSAHGLTARLAYPVARRSVFSKYLRLLHTVVPATHAESFDAPPAVDSDNIVPIDWFPGEILNSLEFYGWPKCV